MLLSNSGFEKLLHICQIIFSLSKNLLFICDSSNINYLPINNGVIFSRGNKSFHKLLKFFAVGAVVVLDFKHQDFLLKRFLSSNCLTVICNNKIKKNNACIHLQDTMLENNNLSKYILFVMVLKFYKNTH